MKTLEQLKTFAKSWYNSRGIEATPYEDTLLIKVQEYEIEVSASEMFYRAELWEEENENN
jgi:hypothetical protein